MTKDELVTDLETIVKTMLDEQQAVIDNYSTLGYSWENESAKLADISRILNQTIGKLNFLVTYNGGKNQI